MVDAMSSWPDGSPFGSNSVDEEWKCVRHGCSRARMKFSAMEEVSGCVGMVVEEEIMPLALDD